jgi:PAS domain S-box-containing protein
MSLQRKTALAVALLVVTVLGALYLPIERVVREGFANAERGRVELNLFRAGKAFEREVQHLSTKLRDWANWDDAYRFVQHPDRGFIEVNLSGSTLSDLELDWVLFVKPDASVVFAGMPGADGDLVESWPPEVAEQWDANPALLLPEAGRGARSGLLALGGNAYAVASSAILPTSGEGEPAGWLVAGRRFDGGRVARLSADLRMRLSLACGTASLSPEMARGLQRASAVVHPLSDGLVLGATRVADLSGERAFVLTAAFERLFMPQVERTIAVVRAAVVAAAAIAIAATFLSVRWLVLLRVSRLRNAIWRVESSGVASARVPVDGTDELGALARSINAMLASIESASSLRAESDARARALAEGVPALIWLAERDGGAFYFNPNWLSFTGQSAGDAVRDGWFSRVHPEDAPGLRASFDRAVAGRAPMESEFRLRRADGQHRWILLRVAPRSGASGEFAGFVASGIDVTDRRQAEMERDRFFVLSMDMMCLATLDGSFTRVNPAFTRVLGYAQEDLLRRPFIELVHPDDRQATLDQLANQAMGLPVVAFENRYRAADGTYKWLSWSAPAAEPAGRTVYAVARDVTQQHEAEEHMRRAKEQAEAANQAKSRFLAHMSHEIRTPLASILGFADLLTEATAQNPAALRHARTIRTNAEHLLTLVNDILDISKIEASRMTLEVAECSPEELARDVEALLADRARAKGLAFEVEIARDTPRSVWSDPTRLRQILVNLVGNAIKFTESGSIGIAVKGDGEQGVAFTVRDTGIGMTQAQLDRIFQPFAQGDESMARRYGGTGLGLSISRALAEMLGGRLRVGSTPGAGASFVLNLPLAPPQSDDREPGDPGQALPALRAAPPAHAGVLLVEDSPDSRRLLRTLIERAGFPVQTAENGLEAIEKANAALRAGSPFGVILMDIQMPVLDGHSAVRRLRAGGYPYPIIALSAHATVEDRRDALDAGCDEYASKPIPRARLIGLLTHRLGGPDAAAGAAA